MRPRLLLACLLLAPAPVCADGVDICYHYGCARRASVEVSDEAQQWLANRLADAASPADERQRIGEAVLKLYRLAAQRTPIWQDKGGNFNDGPAEGRMDCVDHSHNVSAFLHYLQDHGWLRHHTAGPTVWRAPWIINLHYTAVLHETASGEDWAVDTWFKDFGAPPEVVPLKVWMEGYSP